MLTFREVLEFENQPILSGCYSIFEDLYVIPAQRKRGIGRKYLLHTLAHLQDRAALPVVLWSTNPFAISLYSKMVLRELRIHRRYIGSRRNQRMVGLGTSD